MSNIVVTDSNRTILTSAQTVRTVVASQPIRTVVTGLMGPPGAATLSDANDVDVGGAVTGSILVYNQNTGKWGATLELSQQYIDGGQF